MGKITVKHYLNKKLKPRVLDGDYYYRVYVRVTFSRQNQRFPSVWVEQVMTEDIFNNSQGAKDDMIYESKNILHLFEIIGGEAKSINVGILLQNYLKRISDIFWECELGGKGVGEEILAFIARKTGINKNVFRPMVEEDLINKHCYWMELINKGVFNGALRKKIEVYGALLKYEASKYPQSVEVCSGSRQWPGMILNYYEWEKGKEKEGFLRFAKAEKIENEFVLEYILEDFNRNAKEYMKRDWVVPF